MNNKIKHTVFAVVLSALLVSSAGVSVYAISSNKTAELSDKVVTPVTADEDEEDNVIVKDESVYIIAEADGSVNKIIVSDWIKNTLNSSSINDKSALSNLENVNGDETYTLSGDDMCVWDAQGNDIYYQGNISKELPVDIAVTYKLNGETVSPESLAGKNGKFTIRFNYTNNLYKTVEINDKQEKMCVPFAMITGIMLDNEKFSNVEVTNGKLINDGEHTVVMGIAFPGLQDNLNLDADKVEIPDYIEITADVKNFEMSNTITIATNEVFNEMDTEELDSTADFGSFDELNDAMSQLIDGSSELYDGLCTLLEKSDELISGINELADGALNLKNGAADLNSGAGDLANGASELAGGLETLSSNSDTLNGGAKQVFESLLAMANEQLEAAGLSVPKLTIENYQQVIGNLLTSLNENDISNQVQNTARETVKQKVLEQKDAITAGVTEKVCEEVTAKVTEAVRADVEKQVLLAMGMTKEDYDAGVAAGIISADQQVQIWAAIDEQMNSAAVQTAIDDNVNDQMDSNEIKELISEKTEEQISLIIEQNMNSAEVKEQINAGMQQAKSGIESISALKEQLDSYNQFYLGLNQYTSGVDSAKDGAIKLNNGAAQLKGGAAELSAGMTTLWEGICTLKDGTPALISGITELRDGSLQLSDGLKEFNEEGIQKLIDTVDGDIGTLINRIKATVDVSKDYKSFSGISDEMDGQVKFIYRTDAIESD